MARIIPWNLPTIPGDSEGGYTPQPTPGPVRENPYIFDDVVVSYTNTKPAQPNVVRIRTSTPSVYTDDQNLEGVIPNDVVGVASIKIYAYLSDTIYVPFPVDIQTLTLPARAYVKVEGGSLAIGNYPVLRYTCNVYNAAGEIIQQYDKVVS